MPADFDKASLEKTLTVEEGIKAPLAEGETVGKITYTYDGTVIGETELVNKKVIKRSYMRMIFGTLLHWILSVWVMVPLGIIVAVLLVLRWREMKRRQKRRRQRKYANRRNFYQ